MDTPEIKPINKCTFCKSDNDINRHHVIPRRYGYCIGTIYTCKTCHGICEKYADILIQQVINNQVNISRLQNISRTQRSEIN